jgi:hypothetical protein
MEEARAVMARLDRIEALDREHAEPRLVLAELRELVREVEIWAECERVPLFDPSPTSGVGHPLRGSQTPGARRLRHGRAK